MATGNAPDCRDMPRVIVLMATFNGRRWIDDQVDSVLGQEGVHVTLLVSDDGSTDGTREHLLERARLDSRIRVMGPRGGPPGVTANFLHLFTHCSVPTSQFVALCDQDDVWHRDKLSYQINLMSRTSADAVSSNVTSFDSAGHRNLVVKSLPQQKWDFVFEAAGPGSTYVFTAAMHGRLVEVLSEVDTTSIGVHDWLLYALVRAIGGRWVIDGRPTVDYRQHGGNVQGEHSGLVAFRSRFAKLRSGFYRQQFILVALAARQAGACAHDSAWSSDLDALIAQLRDPGIGGRVAIWHRRREIRRDPKEGFELALACLLGVW